MLHELGVKSHYVLVNSSRGVIQLDTPAIGTSNHVVLAIELPGVTDKTLLSSVETSIGRLLLFDPTDEITKFGYLPTALQGSVGILIGPSQGEAITLPVMPASSNRIERNASVRLSSDDSISAKVNEVRIGAPAFRSRRALIEQTSRARGKAVEAYVADYIGQARVLSAEATNVENRDDELRLTYELKAEHYASRNGPLLLLRPRIIGELDWAIEDKKRLYPYNLDSTFEFMDNFEIELPNGYQLDESPPPANITNAFGEYRSSVQMNGTTLRYIREFRLNSPEIPAAQVGEFRKFLKKVAASERASVVLKSP
jgi:hypothetical protein